MTTKTPRAAAALDLIATAGMLIAAVIVTWVALASRSEMSRARGTGGGSPLPTVPLSLEGAAVKGDPSAKVAIVEFADFECPFCSQFAHDTLPDIDRKYVTTGKVILAFRHTPLKTHAHAELASEVTACAGNQNRFWEFYDFAFRRPKNLEREALLGEVRDLHLEMAAFQACLAADGQKRVASDSAMAMEFGIKVTPTFLVGRLDSNGSVRVTNRIFGARGLSEFEAVLDGLLAGRP